MHSAEEYTISIRLESIEGEKLYVARVEELPDVEEYADTFEFARVLALDTIRTTQRIFSEKGMAFPEPKNFTPQAEASGRVTLRLPKSLHAYCIRSSEIEGVSLNTYLISRLSAKDNNLDLAVIEKLLTSMNNEMQQVRKESGLSNLFVKHALTQASNVKTYASTVRLETSEDERSAFKIRNFLSSSLGKQPKC